MLSNDLKQIILLNPVRINYDLKKWTKDIEPTPMDTSNLENFGISGWGFNPKDNVWDGVPFVVRRQFDSPFWRSVVDKYIKFRLLFNKSPKDPVEFFMELKENLSELETTDVSEEKIAEMLQTLEKSKQKFAMSTLLSGKSITFLENKLVDAGFKQYQTEESIIGFIKKCKKGLCFTELEYFDRVIPEDVMQKFDKAEQVGIFDNYYILYHDPKIASEKKVFTEEKPKDPIMFGVIRGSNKLYFIADWIDELCNLTYKDILDKGIDYKLKKEKV